VPPYRAARWRSPRAIREGARLLRVLPWCRSPVDAQNPNNACLTASANFSIGAGQTASVALAPSMMDCWISSEACLARDRPHAIAADVGFRLVQRNREVTRIDAGPENLPGLHIARCLGRPALGRDSRRRAGAMVVLSACHIGIIGRYLGSGRRSQLLTGVP